jgi:predicted AlkP superfamily phosphohydrolase/phosphomutase
MVDFTYPDTNGYDIKVSNSTTCSAPSLWEIVGNAGGKVGVVSMPMTYPPQPVNGLMLCSFLTPSVDSEYTYPSSLKVEIETANDSYPLHMSEKGRGVDPSHFAQAVRELEVKRAKIVCDLLQKKPWDLFVYVFETTDNLQHEVWHLLDETHPRHDADLAAAVMPHILEFYETVDRLLGEMIALVPDDTLVVVMSDHGFGPFHKFFHINNWLAEHSWLKFKRTPLSLAKRLAFRLGGTPINALKWVTRLRLSGMRKNVKRGRGRGMLKRLFLSLDDVDWKRTKAFSVGNFGQVYLNVKGQRPQGIVSTAEYEDLRDSLAAAALEFSDPVDGNQVVRKVYKREEIFHGPSTQRLPDLILHTDRARYVSFGHADFGSNKIIEPSEGQTGHHHMVGVLGLVGAGIKEEHNLAQASILDLAPTILHYMGLPVPSHMDGQVLVGAFSEEFMRENPITHLDTDISGENNDAGYSSDDEKEMVLERLRDMGYVA